MLKSKIYLQVYLLRMCQKQSVLQCNSRDINLWRGGPISLFTLLQTV